MAQPEGTNGTREPTSAARNGASAVVVSGSVVGLVHLLESFGLEPVQAYAAALVYGYVAGAAGKVARDALHRHDTGAERLGVVGQLFAQLFAVLG